MRISKKALADTNILINAVIKESPFHLVASTLVTDLAESFSLVLCPQVILECYNVLVGLGLPTSQVMAYLESFSNQPGIELIFPRVDTHEKALQCAGRHAVTAKRKIFDYFLAQTMIDNSLELVYTQNTKDFAEIDGIQAVNPFK